MAKIFFFGRLMFCVEKSKLYIPCTTFFKVCKGHFYKFDVAFTNKRFAHFYLALRIHGLNEIEGTIKSLISFLLI